MHEDTGTTCLIREDDSEDLLVSVARAGQLIGISRRQMYRVLDGEVELPDDAPRIEDVHIGSRRLVVCESLKQFVAWLRSSQAVPDPSPLPPPQPPHPGPRPPNQPPTPRPPKTN